MSDVKNLEIKVKINLKKMPVAEYEAIMVPYKRLMLQFEKTLRQLADNGVISFSIIDKFTKEFNFAELQRLHFSAEEMDTYQQPRPQQQIPPAQVPQYNQPQQQPQSTFSFSQQQPATSRQFGQQQPATSRGFGQQSQTAQRPSAFNFGTPQQQTPAPTSNYGFNKPESTPFGGTPSSSPRPGTTPPSGFGRTESQSNMFGSGGSGSLGSFSDLSNESSESSFAPKTPPPAQPNFRPTTSDFGSQSKPQEGKISVGIDEEDRATGIAILRKKMLMELRKIRNVVEQEDDSSF